MGEFMETLLADARAVPAGEIETCARCIANIRRHRQHPRRRYSMLTDNELVATLHVLHHRRATE